MNKLLSLYIHIPFCRSRCGYCDFNTYAGYDHLKDAYVQTVVEEINHLSNLHSCENCVHTVYFGGGTPNLLTIDQMALIMKTIEKKFCLTSVVEVTTEANPTNIEKEYLNSLKNIGVNRLSLGMQSADEQELKILGRRHTFKNVLESVEKAKRSGIENINLDLIFGIPYQTPKSFYQSLKRALDLSPSHLSLYALNIEESTPLARQILLKKLPELDEDSAADMYLMAEELLETRNYLHYEISNWSSSDQTKSVHNLQYWRNQEYLGFGAGAHSHYGQYRWENQKTIEGYINSFLGKEKCNDWFSPATMNQERLTTNDDISETMMMGLRLVEEGIKTADFFGRFGIRLEDLYQKEIDFLIGRDLIEWVCLDQNLHLRLTKTGRLLGNQVFMQFIRS